MAIYDPTFNQQWIRNPDGSVSLGTDARVGKVQNITIVLLAGALGYLAWKHRIWEDVSDEEVEAGF